MNPDDAFAVGDPSLVTLSVPGLLLDGPLGVQLAVFALAVAFVWSLVVIVRKLIQFAKARKEADKFEKVFWSGQALDELYQALSQRRNSGMAALFVVAMREWKRSTEGEQGAPAARPMTGVRGRVESVTNVALSRDLEALGRSLSVLPAIAASAPFVGLFGLAWGLMAAFQVAAGAGPAPLANILGVMGPSIASGLLAAALGWLVAIPAKVFSMKFETERARYAARLRAFADEFSAILSRQIDRAS